jgi:hypothetical protein
MKGIYCLKWNEKLRQICKIPVNTAESAVMIAEPVVK